MAPPELNNILVIPLRYIGDTVLTVPLVRNLRHQYPDARLDMLVSRTTYPLMEICPYLNEAILEPSGSIARLRLLRDRRYDAVFILRKSVTMALLCKLAGIPLIVGYDKQRFPWGYRRWGWFLGRKARYPSLRTETPQPVSHLELLRAAEIPVRDDQLELWSTEADVRAVDALLASSGVEAAKPMAVLHATSASHGKQIEPAKFAEAVHQLTKAGYQVLTTGTKDDALVYDQLAASQGLSLTNLAGKTSLRETYELYRRIQILLTVDSSPIHLGAAAGVPNIVGVFGPTNERQWGPHNPMTRFEPVFNDLPCRPCYAKVCSHNNCKVQLSPAQITEAATKILSPPGK